MKVNWWMIAFIAAAAAWGFREGCAYVKKKEAGDLVNHRPPDPVYLPGKETVIIDTQYVPEPKNVAKSDGVKLHPEEPKWEGTITNGFFITDTAYGLTEISTGYEFLIYPDTAYYRDSLPVSHGYAIIQDTVSENRIKGRGFRLNQTLPIMKETVAEKKRNVVYLGLNAQGSKQNFFYSIGADVSLKAKNDRIYSLGVGVTRDNQLLYGAGFRWPVRLRHSKN